MHAISHRGKVFLLLLSGVFSVLVSVEAYSQYSPDLSDIPGHHQSANVSVGYSAVGYVYLPEKNYFITAPHARVLHDYGVWSYPRQYRDRYKDSTGVIGLKQQIGYRGTCKDFISDRNTHLHYVKRIETKSIPSNSHILIRLVCHKSIDTLRHKFISGYVMRTYYNPNTVIWSYPQLRDNINGGHVVGIYHNPNTDRWTFFKQRHEIISGHVVGIYYNPNTDRWTHSQVRNLDKDEIDYLNATAKNLDFRKHLPKK